MNCHFTVIPGTILSGGSFFPPVRVSKDKLVLGEGPDKEQFNGPLLYTHHTRRSDALCVGQQAVMAAVADVWSYKRGTQMQALALL